MKEFVRTIISGEPRPLAASLAGVGLEKSFAAGQSNIESFIALALSSV